jgi:hypothetical protein
MFIIEMRAGEVKVQIHVEGIASAGESNCSKVEA